MKTSARVMLTFRLCAYLAACMAVSAMLAMPAWAVENEIGVFLFSSEVRYYVAYKGFKDRLKEAGYSEPNTVFRLENANANKAAAADLVDRLDASKADLFFVAGTSATTALTKVIKDRPVVFAVIYDPVRAGIAKDWASSGNNTTGVSSKIPMSKVIDVMLQVRTVKRLAVLYTPGEANSELQLRDVIELQKTYGFKALPVPLSKKEDIALVLPNVVRTSDALFVTGSNLVDKQIGLIADIANKSGTLTVTHLDDLVEKGVDLGVSVDPYLMGRMAGEQAIKILKGAKPTSIPISVPNETYIALNQRSIAAANISVPPEVMKKAKKRFQ